MSDRCSSSTRRTGRRRPPGRSSPGRGPARRHRAPGSAPVRRSCSTAAGGGRGAVRDRAGRHLEVATVDRRARTRPAPGRGAGAAQGRPRRGGGRDDDRGGRRRDRAVGRARCVTRWRGASAARRRVAMAYDGAGGRQAVASGQVPGRRRAGRHPRRGRPAAAAASAWSCTRTPTSRWPPSTPRRTARSWSSSAPRAGSAPRSWPPGRAPVATAYRLGPTVLRTSTAGTAAPAALLSRPPAGAEPAGLLDRERLGVDVDRRGAVLGADLEPANSYGPARDPRSTVREPAANSPIAVVKPRLTTEPPCEVPGEVASNARAVALHDHRLPPVSAWPVRAEQPDPALNVRSTPGPLEALVRPTRRVPLLARRPAGAPSSLDGRRSRCRRAPARRSVSASGARCAGSRSARRDGSRGGPRQRAWCPPASGEEAVQRRLEARDGGGEAARPSARASLPAGRCSGEQPTAYLPSADRSAT